MSQESCKATRKDGQPCGSFAFCERCDRCYQHCTHVEEERREARMRAGRTTAQKKKGDDLSVDLGDAPRPPESLEDAASWAAWATHMVATGQLGNTRARTISKLLNTFRQALERGEARRELQELKNEIKEAARQAGGPHLEAMP